MKKFLFGFLIILAILVMLFIYPLTNRIYKEAEVIAIHNKQIELIDNDGNLWIAFADNFKIGQKVKITFDNNDTDRIEDDVIIDIEQIS